uniref:Uncharacterized protein n=1 Tax=Candidatus Methanophaga sp. ANME-1 ERB7 TaxID=2759913 RepID=A0A7G9Z2N1_9EURY|nr:hypothetical protein LPKEAICH_00005 [Methanosarcinales archaeon ANME-1 ERB7]
MSITVKEILGLVGKLDDTSGDETSRERFRRFLKENITEVGQIRDYIEECLRNSGDQYNRALQDLVNYLGHFLGFEVTFGRYQGVKNKIGFDGLWKSPTPFFIVVEVKTTDIYAIKTATLIGYVDALISEKEISDWDHAIGLYVIGRPDAELRQLENAILAEKRTHQLRIISVESLLSLAELFNEYDVSHDDILAVLRPSGTTVDPVVDLMARLVAQRQVEEETKEETTKNVEITEVERQYWLTPVKSDEEQTADECIQSLENPIVIDATLRSQLNAFKNRELNKSWAWFVQATRRITEHDFKVLTGGLK